MGLLKIKSLKKKDSVPGTKDKPKKPERKAQVIGVQEQEKVEKEPVRKGYAKKGDLIAKVKQAVLGKDGKNVLGEKVPARRVYEPRLITGENVRLDKGSSYLMNVDGIVEVFKDENEIHHIRGRVFKYGRFKVNVAQDEMHAYLTVTPPVGGADSVQLGDALDECKEQKIVFGLKEEEIKKAIEKAELERIVINDIVIAEGEDAVDGAEGKIEYKVQLASGNKFKIKEDGSVDFKEQDHITSVEERQLIAVVMKAKDGIKDGHTVKGEVIKAKKGHDVEVSIGNNIREEDKGDLIEYYSMISGQLFTDGKRLSVEPVLTIEGDVGPQTGNINFDGYVFVKGHVHDNFRVEGKQSVTVQGNVGSAMVKSDEDIIIQNGIIGKNKGIVYAKGDITVKFAENAYLQAGRDVHIKRAALNCKIIAGNKIISKKEKGQIIGGELKAKKGVEVKILGNDSENKIEVFTGSDFFLEKRLKEMIQERKKYEIGYKKILLLMDKLNKVDSNQEGLPDKLKQIYIDARKKKISLGIAINDLKKQEQEYILKLSQIDDSEVIIFETLYRGVRMYFGSHFYEPEGSQSRLKVYYDKKYEKIRFAHI
jgi:uncharacterized protein (DUF342 family)